MPGSDRNDCTMRWIHSTSSSMRSGEMGVAVQLTAVRSSSRVTAAERALAMGSGLIWPWRVPYEGHGACR